MSLSSVTLCCHFLVSLTSVTLWCHSLVSLNSAISSVLEGLLWHCIDTVMWLRVTLAALGWVKISKSWAVSLVAHHHCKSSCNQPEFLCAWDITQGDWEIIHFGVPEFPKVSRSPTSCLMYFFICHILYLASEKENVSPIKGQSMVMYNHQFGLTSKIIG